MIELNNIFKSYAAMRALNGVSLSIDDGVTGLLGPNGAGKSTLIKIILGLLQVTSGEGTVLGHQIGTDGRKIREKIGYMPEDDCYIAGMSGVEVVRFAATLTGMPSTEGLRRSHEILDFCGMGQERYRDVETYSTGMRQKIKFAQAIVHDPPLLIFDEPTSGLDPEEREAMLSRVRILCRDYNKTVILSTHILPDVQTVCDNVVILVAGEVRLSEKLDVLKRPASPSVKIETHGDHAAMIERMDREGIGHQVLSGNSISVYSDDQNLPPRVWDIARETSVTILALTPAINSLEKVFVDSVKESRLANS